MLSPMTIERMAQVSELIVEGRTASSWSAWDMQRSTILTYSRFQVTRTLKGVAAEKIIIKQIGGHAEGYSVRVAGVRYLQPGEEHVLFLHPSMAADGTFVIVGLAQGDFQVHPGATETTVSGGMPVLRQQSGGLPPSVGAEPLSVTQLEQRIRSAVSR